MDNRVALRHAIGDVEDAMKLKKDVPPDVREIIPMNNHFYTSFLVSKYTRCCSSLLKSTAYHKLCISLFPVYRCISSPIHGLVEFPTHSFFRVFHW